MIRPGRIIKSMTIDDMPELRKPKFAVPIKKMSLGTYITIDCYKMMIKKCNEDGVNITDVVEGALRSYCK